MAFIQIFSYNTVLLALFCLDCSLSITKPATRGLSFRRLNLICEVRKSHFTLQAAYLGGFFCACIKLISFKNNSVIFF